MGDAGWSGKNTHSFHFRFVWGHVRETRWVSSKKEMCQLVRSGSICCSSCAARCRCSPVIGVPITLGVVGVCGIASRVGGAAEGVHIAVASPMTWASLTVHIVAREPIVSEKAG
jgi:hypothetical protein